MKRNYTEDKVNLGETVDSIKQSYTKYHSSKPGAIDLVAKETKEAMVSKSFIHDENMILNPGKSILQNTMNDFNMRNDPHGQLQENRDVINLAEEEEVESPAKPKKERKKFDWEQDPDEPEELLRVKD